YVHLGAIAEGDGRPLGEVHRVVGPLDERLCPQVDAAEVALRRGGGVALGGGVAAQVVLEPDHELGEAPGLTGSHRGGARAGDVHDCAAVHGLARSRVQPVAAGGLDDQGAEEPVAPGVDGVHVVVPEDGAGVGVRVPAVADELHAGGL